MIIYVEDVVRRINFLMPKDLRLILKLTRHHLPQIRRAALNRLYELGRFYELVSITNDKEMDWDVRFDAINAMGSHLSRYHHDILETLREMHHSLQGDQLVAELVKTTK